MRVLIWVIPSKVSSIVLSQNASSVAIFVKTIFKAASHPLALSLALSIVRHCLCCDTLTLKNYKNI